MKENDTEEKLICSFCGRSVDEVHRMIQGAKVSICDRCIFESVDLIKSDISKTDEPRFLTIPLPSEINKELDNYVIGQDRAKKAISVAVYNHYKRISSQGPSDDVEIEKSNILLIGPTGTGKTLLAQTLARFLHVPFTIVDATMLTEAGYVGEDVENVLVRLLQVGDYDLPKVERGIIYIDEIDKIARKSSSPSITRDVSGEGVQQALLKILEGTIASVPPKGGRKHPEQNLININTKDILFLCGGAFDGLEAIIRKRISSKSMGFGAELKKSGGVESSEVLRHVEPEDLLKYGLIPELIGRLPVISALRELDENALRSILLEPRNSLVKQYKKLFKMDGVNLVFDESAIEKVVERAKKRGTGARALRSILEEAMLDVMYKLPNKKDVVECVINRDVILGEAEPILTFRRKTA